MIILRALLGLLVLLAFAAVAPGAEASPGGQKIEATNLDGLVFEVTIPAASKKKPRPAPFAALAESGHTLTFQGGKMIFDIKGLPPIPPIPFQAYKVGDLVKIVVTDAPEVIDKANKSAVIGTFLPNGAISDAGKSFIGTMTWSVGETKTKKKIEMDFSGARPEKPAKK